MCTEYMYNWLIDGMLSAKAIHCVLMIFLPVLTAGYYYGENEIEWKTCILPELILCGGQICSVYC